MKKNTENTAVEPTEIIVELTKEEREKLITDIVFKKETIYSKKVLDDTLEITLKSLRGKELDSVSDRVAETVKSDAALTKFSRVYSKWLLAYSILKYNDEDFKDSSIDEKYAFIDDLNGTVLDEVVGIYNELQNKLKACRTNEAIEETFLDTPSTS